MTLRSVYYRIRLALKKILQRKDEDLADKLQRLPDQLIWLADAPLFIDKTQVESFYDAVAKPASQEAKTTLEVTDERAAKIGGKFGMEGTVTATKLMALLNLAFAFVKPEVKVSAELEGQFDKSKTSSKTIELLPITTPQRQLVDLTLYYLIHHVDRLFLVDDPSTDDWRTPEGIAAVPRQLVFLDLPGRDAARRKNLPEAKLIPTAAEFANWKIDLLYEKLCSKDGEPPPRAPEPDPEKDMDEAWKKYWQWFDKNFSSTKAMVVLEEAGSKHGAIKWIDFRVPIAKDGGTLHLHACPAGEYTTGTFAYNFIKRGYTHGLRLVGTLRSGPSMNILAIYEK